MPLCCLKQHRNPVGKVWCAQCDSLIAGATIGDYVIDSYLGQGHQSVVYLAHQPKLNNRKVAIKVLLSSVTSQESIDAFRKEPPARPPLSHPYILPIYDYDIIEEARLDQTGNKSYSPYLVLRYAEQGSLEDIFKQEENRPWSLQRVLPIIKEAADALDYAHRQGILHRNIKPANILMIGGHIMLADFSVADLIDVDKSHVDAPWAGSPAYMAPEVWRYKPGRYSDQYALAVTCFWLLTGVYPWTTAAGGTAQWVHAHQSVAPNSLMTYRPDLPVAVNLVLQRALAKEPQARYPTVSAFATALSEAARDENLVGQQLGSYRLVQLLGRGGWRDEYIGEHITLKTQVAVKVLHAPAGEDVLATFHNEAEILSSLHHPYIVQFIEFNDDPIPFLVRTLTPNGTLRERYPAGTRLPLTTILSYVKQVAAALQYMHDKGYIHRNVKPENMALGSENEVLLTGFSVAISPQVRSAKVAGSLPYMAPEQLQGEPLPASDQYALAVVVYEWLCGTQLFSDTSEEILKQHLSVRQRSLRDKNPAIPLDVEQVVLKALAKNPQERFSSVEEFAGALEQASQIVQRSEDSPLPFERKEVVSSPKPGQRDTLWPTREDYDRAMLDLQRTAVDTALRTERVAQDKLGIIHYGGGSYTAVYRVGNWMIRCFRSTPHGGPPSDIIERYIQISKFCMENLAEVSALVPVFYSEQSIMVDYIDKDTNTLTKTKILPTVKMPFILAPPLGDFVAVYHKNQEMMERLCAAWWCMIQELEAVHMAHGDLDLTNVLVVQQGTSLTLKLIDYDNVWIPPLSGLRQLESGHENFQHPAFMPPNPRPYNAEMDRFSALVIYISLRALSLHPDLYEAWGADDTNCLLFSRQGYEAEMQQTRVSTGYVRHIAQLRQMEIGVLMPYLDELSYALQNRCMPRNLIEISLSSANPAVEPLEKIDSPSSLASDVRSAEPPLTPPTLTYQIFLTPSPSTPITIGNTLEVSLYLSPVSNNDSTTGYRFELSRNKAVGSELNILLTAPGFHLSSMNAASLPIEVPTEEGAAPAPQVARFTLVALRPGTAKVSAEVYNSSNFLTNLEMEVEVRGVEEDYSADGARISIHSRPVPQPDLLLQVQTEWNADVSACTLRYVLNSFHRSSSIRGGSYGSPSLSAGWVERSQRLLGSVLEECVGGLSEDVRARLASFGYSLFQGVFPLVLQNELRNLVRSERMLTLLILADQDAWLPWEVLHTGQAFLGEQFVIGRWMRELDEARPYEFPVGGVHVAHYANVPQPEMWVDLLTFPNIPEPLLLPVFADLEAAEAMRGLHLIRYGHSSGPLDLQDAPVMLDMAKSKENVDAELRPAKLSLRRNRPLVSLGYISAGQPELTALEQAWAPTFVRAGCSAFVGPLWAVQPTAQAAFVSGFYSRLWAGDSLAGAVQMGRRLAKAAAPDSLDWLAYVLFGDPMARPYRPVQGQGYALVEPIGREMDNPVPAGGSARFRVS